MSFFGIFWKAEIYINSENKKKKETEREYINENHN